MKYCIKCNSQNTDVLGVPSKFCSNCGYQFAQLSSSASTPIKIEIEKSKIPPKPPRFSKQRVEIEDEDENNNDITSAPSISSLEIEPINTDLRGRVPIGQVAKGIKQEKIERPKPKKQSKKEFWKEFQKESQSAKSKGSVEI